MQLIGPWASGYTRRVGITLKLLDFTFDHLNVNVYQRPEDVRPYNPMLKVPVLILDSGEILLDSDAIIDYLHEQVGAASALIASHGQARRQALRIVGVGVAAYDRLNAIHFERLRPAALQQQTALEYFTAQVVTALLMLEAQVGERWMVGDTLTQADIMTVVVYQGASRLIIPESTGHPRFPRLAGLSERAMHLSAFATTLPESQACAVPSFL